MIDEIFMVFEEVDGSLVSKVTAGDDRGIIQPYNAKKRVFFNRTQANVYRKRLEKQNRKGVVVRFVPDTEID